MEDSHFGQVHNKDRMQLREPDLCRICPMEQRVTHNRVHSTQHHPFYLSSSNMQFQQNMTTTIQDLKMQIGQLANTVSELQSVGSSNLPSQTILNSRGNASAVTLRSGKELSQPAQY
ncbi:hypothetical protein CR513_14615, partial [Mucuna pruriens]